uniref:ATP synthase complex subunit 8 n=1 Tax=Priacanthus tayenus TaxID=443711 RepID=A0A0X8DE55_9TELE|nr:ATP synthase subunit 8 [Priacanthus tayenus]AMA76479.1 ATP synthase subunit 8 [Priacanthus tayenus]ARJ37011.1 ATP synthase F0 subunit 8 [Priacanthus tayenus]
MPQLNPAPWLAVLIFSWLVLLVVIPPKVLAYTFPNNPEPKATKFSKKLTWAWPWP